MLRQSTTEVAMDPFLSGINEQHARQESADSGLGLGTAYSLPHTPEDFLANLDDNMDGTSGKNDSLLPIKIKIIKFTFLSFFQSHDTARMHIIWCCNMYHFTLYQSPSGCGIVKLLYSYNVVQ